MMNINFKVICKLFTNNSFDGFSHRFPLCLEFSSSVLTFESLPRKRSATCPTYSVIISAFVKLRLVKQLYFVVGCISDRNIRLVAVSNNILNF